jgi:glycosyltransferase involved in cell wall biosynthesis
MGFNCFGYETAPTGLGSAARGYADALRTLTANVSRTDVPVWGVETPPVVPEERSTSNPFACNLILQNPDVLALFLQHYGLATLKNRINIAGWVWELHSGYPEWSRLTRLFHEIWVPSTFVADALRPISTVPVAVVPYPVDRLPETRVLTRASLGLPETALIFLYVFDLGSTTGRKNPLALLRAFRDAFGARADVRLVLKYHNTENDPAGAATLERLASGLPNVHLISHTMATDEVYGLIQLADCFVSPHRSEGFGLNIATAMYYGKPVIVTGYSGNMDFTTPQTAFLIDYDVVAVGQGHPHYRPNYGWAEPSPAHLQALLLRVFEHPDFAQRVGAAGQHIIRSRFSMEAVASSIRERLQAITSRSL